MLNKIYKIIHKKFSRYFKFVFFLRYLFTIFIVSSLLFILIPKFFDYSKKGETLKTYLSQNYGIEMIKFDDIKFYSLPFPRLEIRNANLLLNSSNIIIETKKLKLFPSLLSIYNYENFHAKKIKLESNLTNLNFNNLKIFWESFLNLNKKISINNLDIKIKETNNTIINFNKINYSNYGYKKNTLEGEVFNKKFRIKLNDTLEKIEIDLLKTGISFNFNFLDNIFLSVPKGRLKGKILKSSFKSNFFLDKKILEINNFFFRDKNISFDANAAIKLAPYFNINFDTKLNKINKDLITYLNIKDLIKYNDLIRKVNIQNKITYTPQRFNREIFTNLKIDTNLAYGRLLFQKEILISKSKIKCDGRINLLDEYPVLIFRCILNSSDKRELFKKLNIKYKKKDEKLNLIFSGSLNILNNKIKFDNVEMNKNYKASQEDLNYFKKTFENILFDKKFLEIFNLNKIKEFILEIS